MNTNESETDYDELSHWAEHDMTLPTNSATAKRGADAAAAGRELIERVGSGRPSLAGRGGGESPKRQVRLPQQLSDQLDELAIQLDRSPSDVIREAVAEYVHKHSA